MSESRKTHEPESFREFFKRRNGMDYPAVQWETTQVVLHRLAETMADWMDELARRNLSRAHASAHAAESTIE